MKLIDLTLKDFSNEIDSSKPAPGGGSVGAYTSQMGVALARMVGHLTVSKKKFKALPDVEQENFQKSHDELKTYIDKLELLVDEDTAAFNKVMSAFKMPKESDEEKALRKEAIYLATKEATEVPYKAAVNAYEALKIIPTLLDNCNKNALSDLGCGLLLVQAGMESSILNVLINVGGLKEDEANVYREKCEIMSVEVKEIMHNYFQKIKEEL